MNKWIGLSAIAASCLCTSCDWIYEGEVDCNTVYDYKMRFVYDHNMKFADATAHEVKAVTLHAIRPDGTIAWTKHATADELAQSNYTMALPPAEGTYSFRAWCTTNDDQAYSLFEPDSRANEGLEGQSEELLTCSINRTLADSLHVPSAQHLPGLYYGSHPAETFGNDETTKMLEMHLVKNTNNIRVMLQQQGGNPLDAADFEFEITSDNGSMAHDNSILPDVTLRYSPWDVRYGSTSYINPDGSTTDNVSVAIAEFTTGRIMASDDARITVRRTSDHQVVFSIPLARYALMVKSMEGAGSMPDQEYLDRQDDYSFTFFLDQNSHWISSQIVVLSWRLVLQSVDL